MTTKNKVQRTIQFLQEDVWDLELSSMSFLRRFGIKAIRVIHLVIRGFRDDQCSLHASALTFSTLMSIVPVLAVSLALARGLGAGDSVVLEIKKNVYEWTEQFSAAERQEEARQESARQAMEEQGSRRKARSAANAGQVTLVQTEEDKKVDERVSSQLSGQINGAVDQLFSYVDKINFAALGGVGLAFLLWSVVSVLGSVESSFNKVWAVKTSRPIHRKFFDYMGVLIVLPILAVAASSMSVADIITGYLNEETAAIVRELIGEGGMKNIVALVGATLTFSFLIMFMPNTKVEWKAGIVGGFVTAILFVVWLWICAKLQVGAVKYLQIYASFAVLPIMLYWVFVSWEILLFGAEVAFGVQNCTTYRMETRSRGANVKARIALALAISDEIARAMAGKGDAFQVAEYAKRNKIPVRLLNETVDELVRAGMLGKLAGPVGGYTLLRSPDTLSVKDVIDVIMTTGVSGSEVGLKTLGPAIDSVMAKADAGLGGDLKKVRVRDLSSS